MPSLNELCVKLIDTLSSCRTKITMGSVCYWVCMKKLTMLGFRCHGSNSNQALLPKDVIKPEVVQVVQAQESTVKP